MQIYQKHAIQLNYLPKGEETEYEKQVREERHCPECNIEMKLFKVKKKNRWAKNKSYFLCGVCGFKHIKRTHNEILRDLGDLSE